MADEKQTPEKLPYPIRSGAVPTPDGVFPVDLSGGGTRRRRRSHIDLEGHDAKVAAENERAAESQAIDELAAILADDQHPLHGLVTEIRTAAPIIRAQDLLKSAQFRANPIVERLTPKAAEEAPADNVAPQQPIAEALEELDASGIQFCRAATDGTQFLERLSAQPKPVIKAVLGDQWNGEDEDLAVAAADVWAAMQEKTLPSGTAADAPGGESAADQTADESGAQGPAGEPGQPAEAPKPVVVPDPPKPARKRAANDPSK